MGPFKVIGRALRAWLDEGFFLVAMGLVTLLAFLVIIPGPFALAGLWVAAERAVEGRGLSWEVFWEGAKTRGKQFWPPVALILVGYLFVIGDVVFYSHPQASPFPPAVLPWLTAFWLVGGLVWTALSFYLPAVLLEPERPHLFQALRTSLMLAVLHPVETIVWVVFLAVLIGLSLWLPILWALLPGLHATLSLLAVRVLWQRPLGPDEAESGV
jgi:hypothetical protein